MGILPRHVARAPPWSAHALAVMGVDVVFETHSTSEDNERGVATGWLHSRLSEAGREQARRLGDRRRSDGLAAVFVSDLRRAVETAEIAFVDVDLPVLLDWRLRECDYGDGTRAPVAEHHVGRCQHLSKPYPNGESWEQAIFRVGRFLDDLSLRWDNSRVLVIGHVATRWALDHLLNGVPLTDLCAAQFEWQEGWEYRLD
jgi:2,3-bisphosphoglycerate-dependent phosphoglycerate mutase